MCRMLGAMCNDEDLLRCSILEVQDSLRLSKGDYDGIGVGYYRHDDPLLIKRPSTKEAVIDYPELVNDITSNVLVVHIRKATVGAWKDSNTHPFRFRKWLFAHLGHLPKLAEQREEVAGKLQPFLARNISGETDSELVFHLFLDKLYKSGKINDLSMTTDHLAELVRHCVSEIDEICGTTQQRLGILITNGQVMAAVCRGISLHYSHREGILECPIHDDSDQQQAVHRRFRGVMLGAEMADPGHQWREVADGSLLSVSKELELKVQQL